MKNLDLLIKNSVSDKNGSPITFEIIEHKFPSDVSEQKQLHLEQRVRELHRVGVHIGTAVQVRLFRTGGVGQ
jgi:hypothetical protein